MYLCRKMTADSLQAVGNSLGKKDHTTIIHGINKIEEEISTNEELKNNYNKKSLVDFHLTRPKIKN